MNICICCHTQLLQHLKQSRSYWFCPNCYQEMPALLTVIKNTKNGHEHHILKKCATINESKLTRYVNKLS